MNYLDFHAEMQTKIDIHISFTKYNIIANDCFIYVSDICATFLRYLIRMLDTRN